VPQEPTVSRLARELIELRPAFIFTPCGPSLRAIREFDRTVPVVTSCADMTGFFGDVTSLLRPGGYTAGITFHSPESVGKRIELLRRILPGLSRLAVLNQPDEPIAERPIVQPTLFERVVNLKTVQALGINFPQSILQRADWVFE
jgi:putative ABC transport system substrate-binding protein